MRRLGYLLPLLLLAASPPALAQAKRVHLVLVPGAAAPRPTTSSSATPRRWRRVASPPASRPPPGPRRKPPAAPLRSEEGRHRRHERRGAYRRPRPSPAARLRPAPSSSRASSCPIRAALRRRRHSAIRAGCRRASSSITLTTNAADLSGGGARVRLLTRGKARLRMLSVAGPPAPPCGPMGAHAFVGNEGVAIAAIADFARSR